MPVFFRWDLCYFLFVFLFVWIKLFCDKNSGWMFVLQRIELREIWSLEMLKEKQQKSTAPVLFFILFLFAPPCRWWATGRPAWSPRSPTAELSFCRWHPTAADVSPGWVTAVDSVLMLRIYQNFRNILINFVNCL